MSNNNMLLRIPKKILVASVLVLATGIFILALILFTPAQVPAVPTINWTPERISETISPGESKAVPVTFTSSEDISNVAVRVVPELQPFIQVEPAQFSQILKGQPVNVSLIFSAAQDSPLGTFEGTIQLRDASSKSSKTFAKPLPVVVNVWHAAEITANGVTVGLAYPPGWKLARHGFGAFIYNPTASEPDDELIPPDISIQVLENDSSVSLGDFIANYRNGWYLHYQSISETTISGHKAILANALEGQTPYSPPLGAFIEVPGAVVSVLGHEASQGEFFEVLESLNLP